MMHEYSPAAPFLESFKSLTNFDLGSKIVEGIDDTQERDAASWEAMDRILDKLGVNDETVRNGVLVTPLSGRDGPMIDKLGRSVRFGDYLAGASQQHPDATETLAGFLAMDQEDPNHPMYASIIRSTIEGYLKQPLPQE